MNRRDFLAASALAPLAAGAVRGDAFPGMIVRESVPTNLEMPFATLDSFVVPTDRFYTRNHFALPEIDVAKSTLRVEGAVERPLTLTPDDLAKLPQASRPITLECAGNGRVYLVPKVRGVAWGLGAVGNADWAGVALAAVLEKAGVKPGAVEVVFEGADSGAINDDPKSPGPIRYARSVPIGKCKEPDGVLLATHMNGQPLTPHHGAPLRAVVAGWYGMAAVKWLTRLIVVDKPFRGWWQTFDYSYHSTEAGNKVMQPITAMRVKSSIARPVAGDVLKAGTPYRVTGAAWAGEAGIANVLVSTDGGTSWRPATLTGPAHKHAWRLWEFDWTPAAGKHTLMARATDDRGQTQPLTRDTDLRTYMINHVVPVAVTAQ